MKRLLYLFAIMLTVFPVLVSASIYFPDSTNDFHDSLFTPSPNDQFSVTGWYNPSVLSTGGADDQDLVFQCSDNPCSATGFKLNQVNGTGASRAQLNWVVSGKTLGTNADVLAINTWYFVAGTYASSSGLSLYWGAAASSTLSSVSTSTTTSTIGVSTVTLRVGNFVNAVQGQMAHWRFYNRKLGPEEVANERFLSNCQGSNATGGVSVVLRGCWPMNQGELDANTDVWMMANASNTPGWRTLTRSGTTAGISSLNPPVSMAE